MKKLLGILVLGLLLSGNSYAGCKKDIKFTWYKEKNDKVHFDFKNNGSKHVRITLIYVNDAEGDEILEFKPKSYSFNNSGTKGLFVSPYGKTGTLKHDYNSYRFGKGAGWKCSYQKPYETTISDDVESATNAVGDFIGGLFSKD